MKHKRLLIGLLLLIISFILIIMISIKMINTTSKVNDMKRQLGNSNYHQEKRISL